MNHVCRCSDEPCVHASGFTRPWVRSWIRSSPTDEAARQGVGDVLVGERLQERDAGVGVLDGGGVVGPHPRQAVGHQLDADGAGLLAARVLLGGTEHAEQVLHVVAELVRDDVLLRERACRWSRTGR